MDKNEKLFELLEPRILLDASLDFSVSDTLDNVDTIEAMSALIRTFEDQFDPGEDGLLNLLRTELIDGLDGADDLFSIVEGQDGTGFGELEDIFERVRLSGMQVVEDYRTDLNAVFTDAVYTDTILDLRDTTRTYGVRDGMTEVGFLDNVGLLRINGVELAEGTTLSDYLRSADVTEQVFGSDLIWSDGNLSDRIDAYFDTFAVEYAPVTAGSDPLAPNYEPFREYTFVEDAAGILTTIVEFKAAFTEAYDNVIAAADTTALEQISLADVDKTGGGEIIRYSQTSVDEIAVSVDLPIIQTFLDKLDLAGNLRTIMPNDFSFLAQSGVFEYSITAATVVDDQGTTTAAIADVEDDTVTANLNMANFGLAGDPLDPTGIEALFEFGVPDAVAGDINNLFEIGGAPETDVGFLTGTLTSIETGRFGLFDAGNTWTGLAFDGTVIATVDPTIGLTQSSVLGGRGAVDFALRATELDADPANAASQLVELDQAAELELVRYNFDMNLPLSLDAATGIGFGASLTQAVTIGQIAADTTVAAFDDAVDVDFAITSFAGVDAELIEPLNRIANTFYDTGTDVVETFFDALGDGVASVLGNAGFTLGIPLTDFDMTESFGQIADVFQSIPDLFAASPEDFGFPETVGSVGLLNIDETGIFVDLATDQTSQTGSVLTDAQLDALALETSLNFVIVGFDTNDVETRTDVPVDITGWAERDVYGNITDESLVVLAGLIEGQLASFGWAVSIASRAFNFAVTGPGAIQNVSMESIAGTTNLRDLGFKLSQLNTGTQNGTEIASLDVHREIGTVGLEALDLDVLKGMSSVRFEIVVDDEVQLVNVVQPTGGWGANTAGDLAQGFVNEINAALVLKGIDISVAKAFVGADPALEFSLGGDADGRYKIGLDLESLKRANSLQGMLGWMADTVGNIPCIPDFEVNVDIETGEVIFDFEPFVACSIDSDGNIVTGIPSVSAGLSIDNTSLGEFSNVDLQAQLDGTLSAELNVAAGFNIFDIQADFTANGEIGSAILDNVFFDQLSMNAVLDAQATNIVAGLDLGMVEIGVGTGAGGPDPANFIAINTELDITIVGQSDGAFSNRLTGAQLITLGTDTGPGSRLTDLLGRVDLEGGIAVIPYPASGDDDVVIEGAVAGERVDFDLPASTLADPDDAAAEDRQNVLDLITIQNGDDRVDGQDYVMVAMNLEGIDLGFGGLTPSIDEPIFASIGDIFDPINTTSVVFDIAELACLTLVDPNLILDALIGLGDVIEIYEDNLESFFPFLFEDVPLLNDSLMATFDFTSGFNDALQDLRDEGGFSFENINSVFASVFGADVVTINLVTAGGACELIFDLDISFLDDFTQEIPFNFNLVDLLGTAGLSALIDGADDNLDSDEQGDESADVLGDLLTNLVDARADAALVLDPELGLNLSFGIDIAALGGLTLANATATTTLEEIANVTSVITNGAGFDDLRVNWVDATDGKQASYAIDIDALLPQAEGEPDATIQDVVTALQAAFDADANGLVVELADNAGDLTIEIKDPNSTARDPAGVLALFADPIDTAALTAEGGVQPVLAEAGEYPVRSIALADPVDPTLGYTFDIVIAGTAPISIDVPADGARDDEGFVAALNTALNTANPAIPAATNNTILIANSGLDAGDMSGDSTPLLRLLLARLDDDTGAITLETTAFANSQGWDEFSIAITDTAGALFGGPAEDAGGAFEALAEADPYVPRAITMMGLDTIVPDEFEPRVLVVAPPLPVAAVLPLPSDGFTLSVNITVPGSTATDTIDLVIAEDLTPLTPRTPQELVDALNDALRFSAPDTMRTLNLGTLTTSTETGAAEVTDILAGNVFAFELNDLGLVSITTTSALKIVGLPEFGFSLEYTAVKAGLQTGGAAFGNIHGTGSDWEATDASKGYSFAIQIADGDPIDVIVEEDFSRVTRADFVDGLNAALVNAGVDRSLISDTAVIGTTTTLSQILRFVADGTDLTLQSTNFAQVNGYNEFTFAVVGNDISHDVTFEVLELEKSNIARALGFKSLIELSDILNDPSLDVVEGDVSSSVLKAKDITHDAPIIFIDTEGDNATRISANLSLGTPEGLNMVLALGPLEVGIEGGSAFIGASGGEGRGYVAGVVEDIDGKDDGRYDLAHLYGIFQSDDPDFLPLFGLDVDFETRIDLPFSGGFGLLNPDDHGFVYESTLLRTTGNPADPNDNSVSARALFDTAEAALVELYTADINATDAEAARAAAIALLDTHFVGDAQALALIGLALTQDELDGLIDPIADLAKFGDTRAGERDATTNLLPADYYTPTGDAEYGPHFIELNLPGVGLFDCAGILDLLNNPQAIINGLDMMAGTIQGFIDDFMGDLDLPVIGDNLALGAGFFDDFIYDALDEVRADLERPIDPAVSDALPTSLDLINVLLNRALNLMFDPNDTSADQQYIAAAVIDNGEPAIYGALSFDFEVFNADLNVDLALEIPGLNLDVDAGDGIHLRTVLDIDLGFGLDCEGFFVLNDVDSPEIALTFEASLIDFDPTTADTFEAGMSIGGVLEVSATPTAGTDNLVRATIGLDLFGASGIATGTGLEIDRAYAFSEPEFAAMGGGAVPLDANRFDNTVYLSQIDFGDFATFTLDVTVDLNLDLTIGFGSGSFVPEITTKFIFTAEIPQLVLGEPISTDILITDLKFDDIRLHTGNLGQIVGQVLNPITTLLEPITDVFKPLSETVPVSYAFSAAAAIFPILNVGTQITETLGTLADLPTSNPGGICIGTYNFLGFKNEVLLSNFRASDAIFTPCFDFVLDLGFSASVSGPGLDIKLPLLTDPSHALNLLLGNFDRVSLVEADFNLLQADINANISAAIVNTLNLPSWIGSAITGGFTANIDIDFDAGFTVGYDLAGVVNFANSYDPERLLDGIFLDAAPGALVDGSVRGTFGLNAGIAGASGNIGGDVTLTFTDPNNDGKLRLPELLAQIDLASTQTTLKGLLGSFFNGSVSFSAGLSIWGGINFPSPLPDLSFSTTVFQTELFNISLEPTLPDVAIADVIVSGANVTSVLNVGARAGGNLSSISQDANDVITINNNGFVSYTASGQVFSTKTALQTVNANAGIVIAAGEGTNTVDLSAMDRATSATITYTGDGNDTINLALDGTHVVFAGGGRDTINLTNGKGTYYIFAEDGADTLNLSTAAGGTVYVFAGEDFGMREQFLDTFSVSGKTIKTSVTEAEIAKQFTGGAVDLGPANVFENQFTRATQLTGQGDDEIVRIAGSGNANVFTGKGDDLISVTGTGDADIYTGAGNDQINFTGTGTTHTQAGAGADLVTFTGGSNTAYGWGAISQADEDSGTFDHLMRDDGDDIIIGEGGADTFYGQYGSDILGGGFGNDALFGGYDDDLMSGGVLEVRSLDKDGNVGATTITLTDPSAVKNLQTRLQVQTADAADGQDSLDGGAGSDILLGGGGNDTLSGGDGSDLVVGDYGQINVSANRTAETFVSTGMTSTTAGTDILNGGSGGDILVAGGAQDVTATETITDLVGNNTVFGDFGVAEGSRILELVNAFRAIASDTGTIDNITTGAGNDVIIGGERGDIINAGLGGDFVIGDLGSFVPGDGIVNNTYVQNGVVVANTSLLEGDDQISFGVAGADDLFDVALGGGGSDTITSVNGGLAALGDYGQIQLSAQGVRALLGLLPLSSTADADEIAAYNEQVALIERIVQSMETVDDTGAVYGDLGANPRYGDDSLTTTEGGNVFAIMGGNTDDGAGNMGGDTVNLADGLSYIITDDGRLTIDQIDDGAGSTFGQVKGESFSTEFAGNDTVTTANGRDIILTGDLADTVTAGDGLNIVMTDNGTLETADVLTASPTTLTSDAGAGDGNDTYFGGADDDLVVLGGGNSAGTTVTDSAVLGEGDNYAMGDSGQISITLGVDGSQAVSLVSDPVVVGNNDGIDQITAGSSDDFIVLGGGADIADLGDGITYVLASSGALNTTSATDGRLTVKIASADVVPDAVDGDDVITAGLGDDFVVLGLGADTANLGDGTVHIIGGEGTIDFERTAGGDRVLDMVSQLAVLSDLDGDETITAGSGDDFIILGLGDDYVETGDGENRVVGDQGRMALDTAAGTELLTFLSPELGGDDTVFGGAGDDSILLSQGDDYAETFGGEDLIAGDNATLTKNDVTGVHLLEADTQAFGGDDRILAGDGNDLIIGSFGADTIETGIGEDFALGDLGDITFRNATDVETLTYTTVDVGGNDVITATGTGSNILIGQFGDDIITGADDDDVLIGDLSELQLSSFENVLPGQSQVERIEAVVSIRPDLGFDDSLIGADGNDLLIGGFGADSLLGGDGQDFLFGDTVDVRRDYDPVTQIETLDLDTNFAFESGGYDIMDGEDGADILVGGLGADLFFGNTRTDLLAGDAFTGKYITFFPTGLTGTTPLREVDEVNFAGFSAVDVLTDAQVGTSLGVLGTGFLSTFGRDVFDEDHLSSTLDLITPPAQPIDASDRFGSDPVLFLRVIEGFFENEDIIRRISETVYFGVDLDLALEDLTLAFRAYLLDQGIMELHVDMVLFDAMLRRVLDDASDNPAPDADAVVPAGDGVVIQQIPA
ncbi:hypothetical protein L0664_14880 [Octadecabacter sp. G9-8]|uniref:Calcium-binding protein n=1 Tax=Octadecabacter dasysiphoniae TaxID=2909341 RepID=A0ABS9CZ66_9RHOB|nr:calcium-binding protein [Octadecabacter dasysiphoniae]MCF2872357.1 hypothetical protein [Octadecabacter dasysiphoniae]